MSPRAACRLEQLGFREIYDYSDGLAAWLAEGYESEGLRTAERVGPRVLADVPRFAPQATVSDMVAGIGPWELAVVVECDGVVSGVARPEAGALPAGLVLERVMHTAPPTVRPSMAVSELARSMDDAGQHHALVTTPSGILLGLVRRQDLDG